MDESEINAPAFHDVVFTVIPHEDLSEELAEGVSEQLSSTCQYELTFVQIIDIATKNSGQHIPLRQDDQQIEDLSSLTHIVSAHIDFPQYNTAL